MATCEVMKTGVVAGGCRVDILGWRQEGQGSATQGKIAAKTRSWEIAAVQTTDHPFRAREPSETTASQATYRLANFRSGQREGHSHHAKMTQRIRKQWIGRRQATSRCRSSEKRSKCQELGDGLGDVTVTAS